MTKHIFTLIWNKKKKNFLLLLEIFFAFLILFGVFTFVISNLRNYITPLGFDTENVWLARMEVPQDVDSADFAQMRQLLRTELEAIPEVGQVSYTINITPFSNSAWQNGTDENGFDLNARIIQNDEYYEETGGLNIIEGRWFIKDDVHSKYKPVVISKMLRDLGWRGKPVIDSLFIFNYDDGPDNQVKIVGVVDHYKYMGEFTEEYNMIFIYEPTTSTNLDCMYIRVKDNASPTLEEQINKTIAAITKRNDFIIQTLESQRKRKSRQTWIPIGILLGIGSFLIINVALGLFGVLWYNINKRRPEIGLRRTLGATKSDIARQFIGEILMVAFFGIILAAFFTMQFPMMKLFDIENINYYYAMLISAGVIILLVLLCSFYPSRQAALINPAIALHED